MKPTRVKRGVLLEGYSEVERVFESATLSLMNDGTENVKRAREILPLRFVLDTKQISGMVGNIQRTAATTFGRDPVDASVGVAVNEAQASFLFDVVSSQAATVDDSLERQALEELASDIKDNLSKSGPENSAEAPDQPKVAGADLSDADSMVVFDLSDYDPAIGEFEIIIK